MPPKSFPHLVPLNCLSGAPASSSLFTQIKVLRLQPSSDFPAFSTWYPFPWPLLRKPRSPGQPHGSFRHTGGQANNDSVNTETHRVPCKLCWKGGLFSEPASGMEGVESCQEHSAQLRGKTEKFRGFPSTRSLCISQLTVYTMRSLLNRLSHMYHLALYRKNLLTPGREHKTNSY